MVVNPGKHSTLPAENMAACFCCIPLDIVMTKNKSHHSYPQRSDWALLIMVQSQTLQIIAIVIQYMVVFWKQTLVSAQDGRRSLPPYSLPKHPNGVIASYISSVVHVSK